MIEDDIKEALEHLSKLKLVIDTAQDDFITALLEVQSTGLSVSIIRQLVGRIHRGELSLYDRGDLQAAYDVLFAKAPKGS